MPLLKVPSLPCSLNTGDLQGKAEEKSLQVGEWVRGSSLSDRQIETDGEDGTEGTQGLKPQSGPIRVSAYLHTLVSPQALRYAHSSLYTHVPHVPEYAHACTPVPAHMCLGQLSPGPCPQALPGDIQKSDIPSPFSVGGREWGP